MVVICVEEGENVSYNVGGEDGRVDFTYAGWIF